MVSGTRLGKGTQVFAYVGSGVGVSGVGNGLKVWGCNLRSRRRFNLVSAWWRVAKTRKDGLTEKDAVLTKLKDQREEAFFFFFFFFFFV